MLRRRGVAVAIVLALAAVVAVAVVRQRLADKKDDKPVATLEFTGREVVSPLRVALPLRVEFSGTLVAPDTAVVKAKAAGTLVSLAVAEGDRVKAGQRLGHIDLAELNTRAAERDANLAAARAALVQAERSHASNERLAAQNFISPIALENSRAALASARAQVQAAQASLETARVGLREAALVAPIAGIVARRQAVAGEKVSLEQPLLTLVDLARLELAGQVATHEVSRLAPGQPVELRVEGVAQPVAGRIARIAPVAEAGTRSIGVTVALANPGERLRGGQFAIARVELADEQQRLTLPLAAITSSAGQDQVWLIEQGTLQRRSVTLGRRDEAGGRVEVLSGVDTGAQVLAARFENLREGAKAVVVSAATASASASGPAPAR